MSPWHSVKTQKKGVCCSSATLIALCWHSTSRRLSSRNFDKASLRQPDYLGSKEQEQVMWPLPLSQGRQNNQSQSFVPPASWAEAGRYPRREEQIRAQSLQALASTLHRCYPPAPSQAPGQSTLPQIHQFPSYYECWGVVGFMCCFLLVKPLQGGSSCQGIVLWESAYGNHLQSEPPVPGSSTQEACSYHASAGHKGMIPAVTLCLLCSPGNTENRGCKNLQGHPAWPTEPTGDRVDLYYNFGTLAKAPGKELSGKLLPVGH